MLINIKYISWLFVKNLVFAILFVAAMIAVFLGFEYLAVLLTQFSDMDKDVAKGISAIVTLVLLLAGFWTSWDWIFSKSKRISLFDKKNEINTSELTNKQ